MFKLIVCPKHDDDHIQMSFDLDSFNNPFLEDIIKDVFDHMDEKDYISISCTREEFTRYGIYNGPRSKHSTANREEMEYVLNFIKGAENSFVPTVSNVNYHATIWIK
jgi:hypothetical protein